MKRIALSAAACMATALAALAPTASAAAGPAPKLPATVTNAAPAAPAGAAAAPVAPYNGKCFGDVIDWMNIGTAGTVYLTYDSLHYNCVITIRANPTGAKTYMEAGIRQSNAGDWFYDADSYAYYAGPEIVSGYGQCVDWVGQIGAQRRAMYNSHCATPRS